jgi:outer membrane protein
MALNLIAQDNYSMRVVHGTATQYNLGEIVSGDFGAYKHNLTVTSVDGGYLLKNGLGSLPIDLYAKSGVSYYNEGDYKNAYGLDLYIKALWNVDFLENRVRVGFGEGVSYTTRLLQTELMDAAKQDGHTSKFLNYLDISVDFDFGRLIRNKALRDTYIGFVIKHRSGIFGLINNVKHGGSNYNSFYIEKNF